MAHKKLYRNVENSTIGGVASGLADFFDMDITIFRVLFILTAMAGAGFMLYLVLWIAVPPKPINVQSQADANTNSAYSTTTAESTSIPKTNNSQSQSITAGLILIVLGIGFLINIFTDFSFSDLWPILIIALGVIIVVTGFKNKKK